VAAGSWPRSMSLAPSSRITTATGRSIHPPTCRTPSAEVAPLTPAFTTRNGSPAESILAWMRAGYARSGSRPRPAVRLFPRKRTTGTESRAAEAPPAAPASRPGEAGAADVSGTEDAARPESGRGGPASAPPRPQAAASAHMSAGVHVDILRNMMILARDLVREYTAGGRTLTVLAGVDLSVDRGEIVAVVGPSGSGKTTLLGLLAGLDRPTSGTVRLDGRLLGDMDEEALARLRAEKVGFVFQTFQLLPTLTALENVLVPLEISADRARRRRDPRADEARARGLLDRVGLGERVDHYPAQLSGGEQQRVGLARAFANRPAVLFADEPTGNLDAATGAEVIDLLVGLNREAGTAMVLVTHDPELASRASRVVRLSGGRLVGPE